MFYIIKGKKLSHELNFNLFALSIKNLSESKADLKLELIVLIYIYISNLQKQTMHFAIFSVTLFSDQ